MSLCVKVKSPSYVYVSVEDAADVVKASGTEEGIAGVNLDYKAFLSVSAPLAPNGVCGCVSVVNASCANVVYVVCAVSIFYDFVSLGYEFSVGRNCESTALNYGASFSVICEPVRGSL